MNICFFVHREAIYLAFDYSEIAPYKDEDVTGMMDKLKEDRAFREVLSFDQTGRSFDEWMVLLSEVQSIHDFQSKVSRPFVKGLLDKTSTGITHNGLDRLSNDKKNLFIANHRDIILDSAILNIAMTEANLQTCETAIGDNLLTSEIVHDLTKLNKNFTVIRSAGPREMYKHSLILSNYIRDKVTKNESSIWLAQREGRAKDGNDRTQQGLLKMLHLSASDLSFSEGFEALKIRPLSVSYEYDPCDRFKIEELLTTERGNKYEKRPEEDLQNIIAGMNGFKGGIHLSIQENISDQFPHLKETDNVNEKTNRLAAIIDRSIFRSYKLFENNYIAYDMLYGLTEYCKQYSKEKKEEFEAYIAKTTEDKPYEIKKLLIRKYAYPLINWNSASQ
ncbi:MAG: glycerol acyltransferase [Bacteroidota bacterium]